MVEKGNGFWVLELNVQNCVAAVPIQPESNRVMGVQIERLGEFEGFPRPFAPFTGRIGTGKPDTCRTCFDFLCRCGDVKGERGSADDAVILPISAGFRRTIFSGVVIGGEFGLALILTLRGWGP